MNSRLRNPAALVAVITFGFATAACSSSSKTAAPSSTTDATPPRSTRPRAALEFRKVLYTAKVPKSGSAAPTHPCASPPEGTAGTASTVLFDAEHEHCYLVGPTLLTGAGITSASVADASTQSEWVVNLSWGNDDFLDKIAKPLVNKTVAIVLNGVVQSAPLINPGITGRTIEVSSNFNRAEALGVAASVIGVAPSQVHVDDQG